VSSLTGYEFVVPNCHLGKELRLIMDHWLEYLYWELGIDLQGHFPLESDPWVDLGGEG
jgi:hypothetical protein